MPGEDDEAVCLQVDSNDFQFINSTFPYLVL